MTAARPLFGNSEATEVNPTVTPIGFFNFREKSRLKEQEKQKNETEAFNDWHYGCVEALRFLMELLRNSKKATSCNKVHEIMYEDVEEFIDLANDELLGLLNSKENPYDAEEMYKCITLVQRTFEAAVNGNVPILDRNSHLLQVQAKNIEDTSAKIRIFQNKMRDIALLCMVAGTFVAITAALLMPATGGLSLPLLMAGGIILVASLTMLLASSHSKIPSERFQMSEAMTLLSYKAQDMIEGKPSVVKELQRRFSR